MLLFVVFVSHRLYVSVPVCLFVSEIILDLDPYSCLFQAWFAVEEVEVTCLHYNSSNASIVAGFNLGTWTLISLQTLQVRNHLDWNTVIVSITIHPIHANTGYQI